MPLEAEKSHGAITRKYGESGCSEISLEELSDQVDTHVAPYSAVAVGLGDSLQCNPLVPWDNGSGLA